MEKKIDISRENLNLQFLFSIYFIRFLYHLLTSIPELFTAMGQSHKIEMN